MSLSDTTEYSIGDALFNGNSFSVGGLELGLLTAASESSQTEVSTSDWSTYSRQSINATEASSVWTIENSSDSTAPIEFPALASSDSGTTVVGWGLFDSGGTLHVYRSLATNEALAAGQSVTIPVGTITVTFD
tara:strand:- start:4326 stop:4724 length:399 start_codon:yes stop_codon:yes gene_type:complete